MVVAKLFGFCAFWPSVIGMLTQIGFVTIVSPDLAAGGSKNSMLST
jgi:hypothetical protein